MRLGGGRQLLLAVAASAAVFTLAAVLGPALGSATQLRVAPTGSARAEWIDGHPVWAVTTADGTARVVDGVSPRRWYGMSELVGWCPSQRMFQAYYDGSR